jgi:hypothetical protein
MTEFLWWSEIIAAMIGTIASVVWYVVERRRVRYIAIMWGFWCLLLAAFRVARWAIPSPLNIEEALLFNALANWLFLMGALNASVITIAHIVGVKKHGRIH